MINQMVLSREIEWIGYERKNSMLQVEFITGPVYQYYDVPETIYQDFLNASSYGGYFENQIKGRFNFRKIR